MKMCSEILFISDQIFELTKNEKEEICELLEHDEWGLALETLCAIITERKLAITKALYDLIDNAGRSMEMDLSTWEDLKQLII